MLFLIFFGMHWDLQKEARIFISFLSICLSEKLLIYEGAANILAV